jgi:23S rRNA (uracil1939-C5)-methyltransferase
VDVEQPSSDRRPVAGDPECGGCLYAHVAYDRQLALKSEIISDAFTRIAKLALPSHVVVAPSPETGYRMRARLHMRGRRVGFFRENTHEICDARATGQLLPATFDAIDRLSAGIHSLGVDVREIELSENVDASERAVSLDTAVAMDVQTSKRLGGTEGITGFGPDAIVHEPITVGGVGVTLRRSVLAFFQGNRYLLSALADYVVAAIPDGAAIVDLYSGAGLFAIGAAAAKHARVSAVEGDRISAADLIANAGAYDTVDAVRQPVETFLSAARKPAVDVVIVDPPRTGMSREALDGVIRLNAPTLIYVSCDVATLARDSKRLVDAGYGIQRADAFDLFPNTPHVETVVTFSMR